VLSFWLSTIGSRFYILEIKFYLDVKKNYLITFLEVSALCGLDFTDLVSLLTSLLTRSRALKSKSNN
jgi:hypothetical protein